MSIPPLIFLIIYVVLVGIFFILSILNFYHIIRFGFLRPASIIITLVYLALMAVIILLTFRILNQINWSQPIEINLPFISSP